MALMASMALGLISQTAAEAGGGRSKKKNATVTVYNTQTADNYGEIVCFLAAGQKVPVTGEEYLKAGAKLIAPSSPIPTIFPVAPGTGTIVVSLGSPPFQFPYSVQPGKAYTYILGGTNADPTMTLK